MEPLQFSQAFQRTTGATPEATIFVSSQFRLRYHSPLVCPLASCLVFAHHQLSSSSTNSSLGHHIQSGQKLSDQSINPFGGEIRSTSFCEKVEFQFSTPLKIDPIRNTFEKIESVLKDIFNQISNTMECLSLETLSAGVLIWLKLVLIDLCVV